MATLVRLHVHRLERKTTPARVGEPGSLVMYPRPMSGVD